MLAFLALVFGIILFGNLHQDGTPPPNKAGLKQAPEPSLGGVSDNSSATADSGAGKSIVGPEVDPDRTIRIRASNEFVTDVATELHEEIRGQETARAAFDLIHDLQLLEPRSRDERVRQAVALAYLPTVVEGDEILREMAFSILRAAAFDADAPLRQAYALAALFGATGEAHLVDRENGLSALWPVTLPDDTLSFASSSNDPNALFHVEAKSDAELVLGVSSLLGDPGVVDFVKVMVIDALSKTDSQALVGALESYDISSNRFDPGMIEKIIARDGTDGALGVLQRLERDRLQARPNSFPTASILLARHGRLNEDVLDLAYVHLQDASRKKRGVRHNAAEYLVAAYATRGSEDLETALTNQLTGSDDVMIAKSICAAAVTFKASRLVPQLRNALSNVEEGRRQDFIRYALENLDPAYDGPPSIHGRLLELDAKISKSSTVDRELADEYMRLREEAGRLSANEED